MSHICISFFNNIIQSKRIEKLLKPPSLTKTQHMSDAESVKHVDVMRHIYVNKHQYLIILY